MEIKSRVTQPKTCPFCGELPEIMPWHGGSKTKRMVSCENDNCELQPHVTGNTRQSAVSKWNFRR